MNRNLVDYGFALATVSGRPPSILFLAFEDEEDIARDLQELGVSPEQALIAQKFPICGGIPADPGDGYDGLVGRYIVLSSARQAPERCLANITSQLLGFSSDPSGDHQSQIVAGGTNANRYGLRSIIRSCLASNATKQDVIDCARRELERYR